LIFNFSVFRKTLTANLNILDGLFPVKGSAYRYLLERPCSLPPPSRRWVATDDPEGKGDIILIFGGKGFKTHLAA
jgi:hypothetical protein